MKKFKKNETVKKNETAKKTKLLERAEKGVHAVQFQVAMNYRHGKSGFKVDDKLSFEWLEKASGNGSYKADMSLAYLYRMGEQVIKSDDKAVFYYLRAEKKGIIRARQLRLDMKANERI